MPSALVSMAIDVASYPYSQKTLIARSKAWFRSNERGRPVFTPTFYSDR